MLASRRLQPSIVEGMHDSHESVGGIHGIQRRFSRRMTMTRGSQVTESRDETHRDFYLLLNNISLRVIASRVS